MYCSVLKLLLCIHLDCNMKKIYTQPEKPGDKGFFFLRNRMEVILQPIPTYPSLITQVISSVRPLHGLNLKPPP